MEIIKRIHKQVVIVVFFVAIGSLLIEPKKLPLSIILGGLLGILNLKVLSWGIESLLHTQKATTKLIFLTIIRLSILASVITSLAILRLINLFGILIGFSIVFAILLKEGLRISKEQ
ncbi:MAG: ATP synthase subunit I [Nitrospirae bacterium]|nr:ATP synthase subunit I [Nitrospirota bacterium]